MAVTLKLNDADAKLVSDILIGLGEAGIEARKVTIDEGADGMSTSTRDAMIRVKQSNVLGGRGIDLIRKKGHGTPEELLRIGYAFDTACFANEERPRR